ncbi:hypothetical protein [Streptomyces goshikiensis]|uniref:hypothetical protein n=1 Tax=Streptomyces goshikiensis TaxID=1942 RepID=UPI003318AD59
MPHDMEKPRDPEDLYRALGNDVNPARPILTGDVIEAVEITNPDGTTITRTVMVLDHPCSLRTNGVDLADRLHVAEVRDSSPISWREGGFNRMPLPAPMPGAEGKSRPLAAYFDTSYHISPAQLLAGKRIACLSVLGIDLMLQRRVKHFSRVTVPTDDFDKANIHVYEEADLLEEWCMEREDHGVKAEDAFSESLKWLREDLGGRTRQDMLKDAGLRSTVRQQMGQRLRELRAASYS